MTLQIGRCGTDFTFRNPSAYQVSGQEYEFSGWINAGTEALAKVARDQLLGLSDRSEPEVPVVYSQDTSLNGWYRVNSVTVTPQPGFWERGVFEWSISASQIGRQGVHRAQSLVGGDARATGHAVTPVYWHTHPSDVDGYPARFAAYTSRVGPGGTVYYYESGFYSTLLQYDYNLDPADWYDMAATVKVDGYTVQGFRHQTSATWEASNGILKVEPGTGGLLKVTAPSSTPSAWSSVPTHWKIGYWDGSAFQSITTVDSVRVFRNDPINAVVQLGVSFTSASSRPRNAKVSVGVRRGSRLADIRIQSDWNTKWGIETVASTAGTAITGGMNQTSDDAESNRWVVCCAAPFTTSVGGPSRLYLTSDGSEVNLGVGVEYGGTGSASPERETDLRDQYFAVMGETVRIIGT